MDAPELDYAYLADFAQVSAGKLTAVGASYTFVTVEQFPAVHSLYVAGRMRVPEGEPFAQLSMKLTVPDKSFDLTADALLEAGDDALPYDGKIGLLFSAGVNLPLPIAGLYTIDLSLGGEFVRRLAFEAMAKEERPL